MSQNVEQLREKLSSMRVTPKIGWTPRRSGGRHEDLAFASAIEADSDFVGTYKWVLDEDLKEWRALREVVKETRAWWELNSFPYVYKAQRLFQRERRKEVIEKLSEFHALMKQRARALDGRRADVLAWARAKFPRTFDASVYPVSWEYGAEVSWAEHSLEPPKYLERDDAEEYQRELQKSIAYVESSMKQFESQCYQRLSEVSYGLAHALSGEGKQTVGLNANVRGVMELFDRVVRMRFEGTAAFRKCLRETKELVDGVGIEELKKPGGVKEQVRARLQEIVNEDRKLRELVAARAREKQQQKAGAA